MCIDNKYDDITAGNDADICVYKYNKYINSDIIFGCKCPKFWLCASKFGYKYPNIVYRLDKVCLHGRVVRLSLSVMTYLWEV